MAITLSGDGIARANLAADVIDGTKIADDSIESEHYAATSIDNEHLADDAVGVAELSATGTASSSTFLRGDNSWQSAADATKLPLAGGTMSGDLILEDNVKIELGNASGGDLQIYHNASNSYVSDQGTGHLKILGTHIVMMNAAEDKNYLYATDGDSVALYHNNNAKLATSATGVTVTGKVAESVDGSTVASNAKRFTGQYDGRETSTITLTCPFEPKSISVLMAITNTNCAGIGMSQKASASSSIESVLVWNEPTGGNEWTYTNSYCGLLALSASIEVYLTVTAWSDTTLTLTKSHVGGGTAAAVRYMVMAYG